MLVLAQGFNVVGVKIFVLLCFVGSALTDCQINVPYRSQAPTFYKYVGTHKLKINLGSVGALMLHDEQKIEALCDISFEKPTSYKTENKLYITCNGGSIFISSDRYRHSEGNYYSYEFECSVRKWNLYEVSHNFEWCPTNVTSYMLARPKHSVTSKPNSNYEYFAGICYDIYNSSFHSVFYTAAPKKVGFWQPAFLGHLYEPSLEVKYIQEAIAPNSFFENVHGDIQTDKWIKHTNYEFHSISEHMNLYNTLEDKYLILMKIAWWQNLRLYNWQRYLDALDKHMENDNKVYDILAGVSGTMKAPILKSCNTNYTMEEVVFNQNQHIPLYIWNYLQGNSNKSNDVVIIGFNSPFNEFYSLNDIVFCPDKCHEIPWLREASSSFRYGIMGIVFCCNIDDVRSSKRLHGFPAKIVKSTSDDAMHSANFFQGASTESNIKI